MCHQIMVVLPQYTCTHNFSVTMVELQTLVAIQMQNLDSFDTMSTTTYTMNKHTYMASIKQNTLKWTTIYGQEIGALSRLLLLLLIITTVVMLCCYLTYFHNFKSYLMLMKPLTTLLLFPPL
mgnify:CR=1 FL=1